MRKARRPAPRYDREFYDTINQGSAKSARLVVPMVLDLFRDAGIQVASVVDVGCGEGMWAAEFAHHVDHVTGVDGPHVDPTRVRIRDFLAVDLAVERVSIPQRFDLAVSLEVAEHLRPERAEGFVEDLCTLADAVLFSAAVPGQGGTGHYNEAWPAYWAAFFESHDFVVTGALRWLMWEWALTAKIESWFGQNCLLAVRRELVDWFDPWLFNGPHTAPIPVVYPVLWDHVRP